MIIPAIIGSLFLGIAFDIGEFTTRRISIYDPDDINSKLQVHPEESLESKYLVVRNTSDLIDFFEIDPALALRERYRSIGLPFKSFLQSSFDRQKVIEIVFYVKCKLETRTFPSDTKLKTDWQTRRQKYVGTHFVKSITTGGNLLISYEVKPLKPEYEGDVRAAIASYLGNSGIIDENLIKKVENLSKVLDSKAYVGRRTQSLGIGLYNPPSSMKDAVKFALDLPKMLKKTGKGKGAPLDMEVVDLHTLAPNFTEYKTNPALVPVLREAFAKLDDILVTKEEVKRWMENDRVLMDDRVNEFYSKVSSAKDAMSLAIIKLDVGGPPSQFDAAFQAYGAGEGSDKYTTELRRLKKIIG